MLKIKDNTSKQNNNFQDIKFWDDILIIYLINAYKFGFDNSVIINDEIVNQYNERSKQRKSNMAFVRQVRKLNKQGYFDLEKEQNV